MKKFSLSLLLLFFAMLSKAQDAEPYSPQMADKFREDGKIYVVITVIAIIFAAIIIFLALLERKLKKLETRMDELNSRP